jgi:hypothetical protein
MAESRIYIESKTFDDLSNAIHELIKYLQWLNERKDLEAINKLSPIVGRMTDLFVAITEGAFPRISHAVDTINQRRGKISQRIAQANTPEEIEQLSKEVDKLVSDYQKRMMKLRQKRNAWENQVGSSDQLTAFHDFPETANRLVMHKKHIANPNHPHAMPVKS